jgi:predicted O-methyltransferase YrrM
VSAPVAHTLLIAIWKRLPEPLRARLRRSASIQRWRRWHGFSGDTILQSTVRTLFRELRLTAAVETGTCYGETTGWLAQNCPKVFSIEVKPEYHEAAAARLDRLAALGRVTLILGNSSEVLASLDPQMVGARPFFFLDAHWYDYWPLVDEVASICQRFERFVVLIHDFEVPGHPDFVSYPGGGAAVDQRPCNLELIRPSVDPARARVFYPRYRPGAACPSLMKLPGYAFILRGFASTDRAVRRALPAERFFEASSHDATRGAG